MPVLIKRDAGGGSVKHPADLATLELPGLEPAKRGRGRPRKADALTPAERASRYRQRQKTKLQRNTAKAAARWHGPNGEYWSGKGKPPIWFVAAIAAGISQAEMDALSGRCYW